MKTPELQQTPLGGSDHRLVRNLHSEAAKNGITITPTETMDDKCPDCGGDICDLFHVEEWARTYCDECLDRELLKFLPNAFVEARDQ